MGLVLFFSLSLSGCAARRISWLVVLNSWNEQEVPDNKRRVSILKGIVIARRNAGLNTTFRLRRLVAGVGVESLFPL